MNKRKYVIYAVLAAVFYSLYQPFSKIFLNDATDFMIVSFLYLGAFIFSLSYSVLGKEKIVYDVKNKEIIYLVIITICNILAPMFLLFGLHKGLASNAALLSNFEVAVTTIIAVFVFKEKINIKQAIAIGLMIVATIIIGIDIKTFKFDVNNIYFILSTLTWAINNNCVAKLSKRNTIAFLMHLGLSVSILAFIVALILNEPLPSIQIIIEIIIIGIFSYGLCYLLYIKAQSGIGAALTAAYFDFAPFFAAFLCIIVLKEKFEFKLMIGLLIMLISTIIIFRESKNENM